MVISFDITTPTGEKKLDTKPPAYNVRPIADHSLVKVNIQSSNVDSTVL